MPGKKKQDSVILSSRGSCLNIFPSYCRKTCNDTYLIGTTSRPASPQGRVAHEKLNQTAPYRVFCVRWNTFVQVHRHDTRKSTKRDLTARLVKFLVFNPFFGRNTLLIDTYHIIIGEFLR